MLCKEVFQTLHINESKQNYKICSCNPQEDKEKETKGKITENENQNDRLNIPIITLNVNDLNTPIKRQRL